MVISKAGIQVKTKSEIKKMAEGGKKLAEVKARLKEKVEAGVNAWEIERLALELIGKSGGEASFKMVDRYDWATCVNINEGVVHGIPKRQMIFKKGDLVSVDVGIFYQGFHTDTSFSKVVGGEGKLKKFMEAGRRALEKGIGKAVAGGRIYDISLAVETEIRKSGCAPVRALVGHGVGKDLHEEPQIPCFVGPDREDTPVIPEGATLAIEVMYSKGTGGVKMASDGWTIVTSDGTISALFEDTIAVANKGPIILTS